MGGSMEGSGSQRRRAGALVSYVYMVAQIVVQLIYVPLLLSGIGQEEYGLYQLVGSIMSYVISVNSILAAGVSRYYCMYRSEGDARMAANTLAIAKRLYWAASAIALVIVGCLIPVVQVVYKGSFTPAQLNECSAMLAVLGLNTVVTMNNTINIAAITAEERFVFLKGSQLVTLVVQPVLVILLVRVMPNAFMVTLVVLAMNALCALIQRIYAQSFLKVQCTYYGWDKSLVKGLLGFSVSIVLVVIADQIFWKADQLIIGYISGAALVAVYAVGSQIYMAYMNVGTVVSSVFFPRVSELYHGEHDIAKVSELYARVGRITFMICSAVLGAFIVVGPDFIRMWAGDSYSDAYLVAVFVMIPLTVDLVQNLANTIMQVADKYLFRGIVLLVLAIINIATTIALVAVLGIVGAALSTGAALLIGNGVFVNWYLSRHLGVDVKGFWQEIGQLVPSFLIAMVVCAAIYWFLPIPHQNWLCLVLAVLLYELILFGLLWTFGMNDSEKGLVLNILHKVGLVRH